MDRSQTEGGTQMTTEQLQEELDRLRPLAELGRLAATVAHEVRNPLAGISANAELLRESLVDPDDIEGLDIILGEVERLGTLVSDLLLYSRERHAESSPIDLAALANRACDLLATDARNAGVELGCDGTGLAWGDSELSQQALLNVVRNAIQACRPGGLVRCVATDGVIRVEDEGTGVPEALQSNLFEPFVTGHTRGLGLGAAVAKRCLSRQQGEVVLVSTCDLGSVFELRWPQQSVA